MIGRRQTLRAPGFVSTAVWVAGTLAFLALSLARWISPPAPISIPRTPVDRVNGLYARQWALVQEAKTVVPTGQSYTAIAKDREAEMLLFMLSLGVLTDRLGVPTSYWKGPVREGAGARYVVSYECVEPEGAVLVRRFPEGCIWERRDPRP